MNRLPKYLFNDLSLLHRQLFSTSYQTTSRIIWFLAVLLKVFCQASQGTRICNDTGRPPTLKLLMIALKHILREAEAIEPSAIAFEVVVSLTPTVSCNRIEVVTPKESCSNSGWYTQSHHRIFQTALPPASFLRSEPDLGRNAGGSTRRVSTQLVRSNRLRHQISTSIHYTFSFK